MNSLQKCHHLDFRMLSNGSTSLRFYMCSFILVVIYFCESNSIRRFMARACRNGLCNGEYVFVYLRLEAPEAQHWKNEDEDDLAAKEAYTHLIWVCTVIG